MISNTFQMLYTETYNLKHTEKSLEISNAVIHTNESNAVQLYSRALLEALARSVIQKGRHSS